MSMSSAGAEIGFGLLLIQADRGGSSVRGVMKGHETRFQREVESFVI